MPSSPLPIPPDALKWGVSGLAPPSPIVRGSYPLDHELLVRFTFASLVQGVSSAQFSSVTQLCPTLCDPMDCSTPGFPVDYLLVLLGQHLILRAPMVVPSWLFVLISADIYSLSFSVRLYTQEFT